MMTRTAPLTPGKATADAMEALSSAGIRPAKITSTDMGDCPWLGGVAIETEARVTFGQMPAALRALLTLPGATECQCQHACAAVYRLVSS